MFGFGDFGKEVKGRIIVAEVDEAYNHICTFFVYIKEFQICT